MGKGNSNRPCAITAALMLLAESNREPNTKAVISEIIAEGNLEDVINNPKVKEAYFEG